MLGNKDVMATIGVRDMKVAAKFYDEKVGLKRSGGDSEALVYESGNSKVFVYESKYAGTNQATAATWLVDNIEAVVGDLEKKGVRFEHYEMPNTTLAGNIHVSGKIKNAWFKDPDGNILAVVDMGGAA